jgi:hypothetical protein
VRCVDTDRACWGVWEEENYLAEASQTPVQFHWKEGCSVGRGTVASYCLHDQQMIGMAVLSHSKPARFVYASCWCFSAPPMPDLDTMAPWQLGYCTCIDGLHPVSTADVMLSALHHRTT